MQDITFFGCCKNFHIPVPDTVVSGLTHCFIYMQLLRCIIPIWRPPNISGGRQLENEMYISGEKMYVSTGKMFYSYLATASYIWRPPLRE